MTAYIIEPAKNEHFSHEGLTAEWINASTFVLGYEVTGFWSQPLKIYVKRDCSLRGMNTVTWSCEVSHSSGGKETETVEESLQATLNLAAAMTDAVAASKVIMDHADELEAAFQARLLIEHEARERAQAERQAMIDADVAIGEEKAAEIVAELGRKAKAGNDGRFLMVSRGESTLTLAVKACNSRGRNTFYVGANRTSMQKAIQRIATSSAAKSHWDVQ